MNGDDRERRGRKKWSDRGKEWSGKEGKMIG